ncbi:Uncharacterized protein DBV15_08316 [Temnothorax longispinosus]|uniref:Uncharacterized protein n=1 Tax=Temnothorax longispinosus TaxID=300112 RepID=A0A4S2L4I3_9HYME|nr:Uncharacterized protein DBV15_08316 [Temnothorax longispinosus]
MRVELVLRSKFIRVRLVENIAHVLDIFIPYEECSISYYMSFRGRESAGHFGNRNLIYWKPAAYRRILYLPTPGLIKALSDGTTGTTGTPGRQINRSDLPPCHLIPEPINLRSRAVFYSERSLIKNHLFVINRVLLGN